MIVGLIQSLEEETKTNKYMVGEVHPKEIAALKKVIENVEKTVLEPAMGPVSYTHLTLPTILRV